MTCDTLIEVMHLSGAFLVGVGIGGLMMYLISLVLKTPNK
jgi:hypothetical protein